MDQQQVEASTAALVEHARFLIDMQGVSPEQAFAKTLMSPLRVERDAERAANFGFEGALVVAREYPDIFEQLVDEFYSHDAGTLPADIQADVAAGDHYVHAIIEACFGPTKAAE